MSALRDILTWLYWHPFRGLVQALPASVVYRMAALLGHLLHLVARRKRKALHTELALIEAAVPDYHASPHTVQDALRILMSNELEVLLFPKLSSGNITSFVDYSGLDNLDDALARGKGAMLLFAHFGANQMIMPAIGYRGYSMSQLSAPPTVWPEKLPGKTFSPMAREALEIRWRHEQSLPVTHVNIFGSLKKAFLCLKRNEVLGVAMDGGGGKTRRSVAMLGRDARFSTGAMEIAMRTGCAVLPTFMVREPSGRHRLVIEPALPMVAADEPGAVETNMARFAERLHAYVLQHPSHYLNFLALRSFMARQGDDALFPEGDES